MLIRRSTLAGQAVPILCAHRLPPKGTGGATAFVDTRTHAEPDEHILKNIKDYIVHHSLWRSPCLAAPNHKFLQGMNPEVHLMARDALVQMYELIGHPNLYITHHSSSH
jgi:alpha-ketoglutarate-dependent 2,4-dichlorophenoxyacetate dioxygenase